MPWQSSGQTGIYKVNLESPTLLQLNWAGDLYLLRPLQLRRAELYTELAGLTQQRMVVVEVK